MNWMQDDDLGKPLADVFHGSKNARSLTYVDPRFMLSYVESYICIDNI